MLVEMLITIDADPALVFGEIMGWYIFRSCPIYYHHLASQVSSRDRNGRWKAALVISIKIHISSSAIVRRRHLRIKEKHCTSCS